MSQPTFILPCEYGLTVRRNVYGQSVRLAATASGAVVSDAAESTSVYEIKTVPIDNDLALNLDTSLQLLKGSFFYSQFYFDDTIYKYRILDDSWDWQVIGPTANVFTLQVERVYEPTVDFAIDYDQSQDQQVSAHVFRIAASGSAAVPSATTRSLKTASVRTRPMAKTSALALENTLTTLSGSAFYSQIYLDTAPRLYRLQPYQWQWTPAGENAYVCVFTMAEVMPNTTDIPCADTLNVNRSSRIKTSQFGDGYQQVAPDGINTENYVYDIETLPLSDAQAASVESSLTTLRGNIFYSQFRQDTQPEKYRLDGNNWSWQSAGKDANVFQFKVKRAYDL
jgi:phage-related protein